MATNVTTDHIKYMEQQLKDKQIHLEKAIQRMTRFNEVTLPAKKNNPKNKNKKNIQDREPIDIESKPEIINLRRAIAHYEYAIEAMKEKQARDSDPSKKVFVPKYRKAKKKKFTPEPKPIKKMY